MIADKVRLTVTTEDGEARNMTISNVQMRYLLRHEEGYPLGRCLEQLLSRMKIKGTPASYHLEFLNGDNVGKRLTLSRIEQVNLLMQMSTYDVMEHGEDRRLKELMHNLFQSDEYQALVNYVRS